MKKILSLILVVLFAISPVSTSADGEQSAETLNVFDVISEGIASAERYISNDLSVMHSGGGVTYGVEWYIIAMLRAGKTIDEDILNEYYQSVEETVINWSYDTNPTDIERTVLALLLMEKDITDVNGVNLAELIYNNPGLTGSSTDMGYALLALDARQTEIPDDALWTRDTMVENLLAYQTDNGSFGLNDNITGDIDLTAMHIQALAPYMAKLSVSEAVANALAFLKNEISENFNYADNSNTTAQVLFALSVLGTDVTDEESGFSGGDENIITALNQFKNPDGNGYMFGDMVNGMATVQVMQSFDAYRKIHMDSVSYWDFTSSGNLYDDENEENNDEDNSETAEPVVIYVTIASEGRIVTDKNGEFVAQVPVTVTDNDENGLLTVDEALYATHELLYSGGASAGYISYISPFGLSLAKLWGYGSMEMPTSAGYWLNNASCWSLADVVSEGDYLTAFNYNDTISWSDAYSYFENNELSVKQGNTVTAKLMYQSGYGENYAPVFSVCTNAKIMFLGSNNSAFNNLKTNSRGQIKIKFPKSVSIGDYYIIAYKDDGSIVPSACKITVTSGGGGGDVSSDSINVHIKVGDPEGETFLSKTKYTVEEGTTVYELLEMTGLEIVSKNSLYGTYVSSIEGLAEFDEGDESGWMYRVNKKFPSYSISSYILCSNDYVEILYTRDGGEDIGKSHKENNSFVNETKEETKPIFKDSTYNDINVEDWYYDAVKYTYENNLMKGTGESFEPESKMTRAMFVTVLWRIANEPDTEFIYDFNDVNVNEWYGKAISWAKNNNIVSGITEKDFGINSDITREQLITILYRYTKTLENKAITDDNKKVQSYDDFDDVSEYAEEAIRWAVDLDIINGTNENKLMPKNNASRAEVAAIIMRFCTMLSKA